MQYMCVRVHSVCMYVCAQYTCVCVCVCAHGDWICKADPGGAGLAEPGEGLLPTAWPWETV